MLIEHLKKALQAAHNAGDMKLVSSIAKMIQDLESTATVEPSASITPNIPPMMSLTEAPARIGLPGNPVMYASPPIICTTSSSARRFS